MTENELESKAATIANKLDADVLVYYGTIDSSGYEEISNIACTPYRKNIVMLLSTLGGEPDKGYRIARCLKHHYEKFTLFVPGLCKSAGTLLAIGADELVIADRGELGPLDIQLKKPDELYEMASGLDINQAMDYLLTQSLESFKLAMFDLKINGGITTRLASEIATKLTTGIFSPIFAQVDPNKIGEIQRAISIANAYGERLNKKAANLKSGALSRLILDYPSHSFVIDRKEASTLFERVRPPSEEGNELCNLLYPTVNNWQTPPRYPIVLRLNKASKESCDDDGKTTEDDSGIDA